MSYLIFNKIRSLPQNLAALPQIKTFILSFFVLQADPSSVVAPMPAGTPVSNDLFSQALQQALQATNMSALQVRL